MAGFPDTVTSNGVPYDGNVLVCDDCPVFLCMLICFVQRPAVGVYGGCDVEKVEVFLKVFPFSSFYM